MHWPVALAYTGGDPLVARNPDGTRQLDTEVTFEQAWAQMEEIQKKGKAKSIAVSNCSIPKLEQLLKVAKVIPSVNQVECHPLLPQHELKAYCESKGIKLQAYSPVRAFQYLSSSSLNRTLIETRTRVTCSLEAPTLAFSKTKTSSPLLKPTAAQQPTS